MASHQSQEREKSKSVNFEYINVETRNGNQLRVTSSKIVRISKIDQGEKEETLVFEAEDLYNTSLTEEKVKDEPKYDL